MKKIILYIACVLSAINCSPHNQGYDYPDEEDNEKKIFTYKYDNKKYVLDNINLYKGLLGKQDITESMITNYRESYRKPFLGDSISIDIKDKSLIIHEKFGGDIIYHLKIQNDSIFMYKLHVYGLDFLGTFAKDKKKLFLHENYSYVKKVPRGEDDPTSYFSSSPRYGILKYENVFIPGILYFSTPNDMKKDDEVMWYNITYEYDLL